MPVVVAHFSEFSRLRKWPINFLQIVVKSEISAVRGCRFLMDTMLKISAVPDKCVENLSTILEVFCIDL